MTKARLFVALAVPAAGRDALDQALAPARAAAPALTWTRPDGWHLTLAFLGWVATPVEEVAAALGAAVTRAPGRIALRLGAPGHFARRVLWVAVDDHPEGAVARLGRACQVALDHAGIQVDKKRVRPHVTVARARDRTRFDLSVVDAVATAEHAWVADEVTLFQSRVGGGQVARYEALASVSLA